MNDDARVNAIETIRLWFGVKPPNAFAEEVIGDVAGMIAAFEKLPPLAFEAEPSDFVRVLHAFAEE
jgi:hypothetical protein